MSPTGGDQQEAQPRLFDEFNDDGDDEDGYGYGTGGGGKGDDFKVILVAPNRSPAMPPAAAGCCGGPITHSSATTKDGNVAGATVEGGEGSATAANTPTPVLARGWAGADATGSYWQARDESAEKKREEEAAVAEERGLQGLPEEWQTVSSGTEVSRFRVCMCVCVRVCAIAGVDRELRAARKGCGIDGYQFPPLHGLFANV